MDIMAVWMVGALYLFAHSHFEATRKLMDHLVLSKELIFHFQCPGERLLGSMGRAAGTLMQLAYI
jgi:hypothetical protein